MQSIHKQDIRGQVNAISPRTTGCRAPGFETMQTFHYLEIEFPLLNSNLHHYITKSMISGYGSVWILSRSVLNVWERLENHFLWVSIRSSGGRYRLMLNLCDFMPRAKVEWNYFLLFKMNWSQITAREISRWSWQKRLQMNSQKAVEVQSALRLV